MRFNQATDYAFRTVLYLARHPDKIIEAKQIAEQEKIPIRFLLKTVRLLTKAGIIKSYRGVNGGYTLAKNPDSITLRDVVNAVEGPVEVNRCLNNHAECSKDAASWCPIHKALANIQQSINRELDEYTFAYFVDKIKSHKQ